MQYSLSLQTHHFSCKHACFSVENLDVQFMDGSKKNISKHIMNLGHHKSNPGCMSSPFFYRNNRFPLRISIQMELFQVTVA